MKHEDRFYEQIPLFGQFEEDAFDRAEAISTVDPDIIISPNFFGKIESDQIFAELHQRINWKQEKISLYGKRINLPRLTSWYGDRGRTYAYSRIVMDPQPWTPLLKELKSRAEAFCRAEFNSALLNLYRDGSDSIAWHSDDEKELGANPTICSLSFGESRIFKFRHRFEKDLKFEIQLTHGSLLLMQGKTQHFWQHQIPKTCKPVKSRINLTFRKILQL